MQLAMILMHLERVRHVDVITRRSARRQDISQFDRPITQLWHPTSETTNPVIAAIRDRKNERLGKHLILGPLWGSWHLPLWLIGRESNPLILFPAFVVSAIPMSVLLTWIYNSTGGSLLIVVLLHATANLPVTLLLAPLGSDMIQPFLIFTPPC